MGLGKTITCVALIAATLDSARAFASSPLAPVQPRPDRANSEPALTAAHFSGSVWGMPDVSEAGPSSAKGKAKAARIQDKAEADYARASRIKTKSRATLIVCPLSTVSNWEDQFREHWRGSVSVVGGAGSISASTTCHTQFSSSSLSYSFTPSDSEHESKPVASTDRQGRPFRIYVYHGNARRPDPEFLADFDAVITTYATLASEFSKQNRSIVNTDAEEEDDDGSSDGGGFDVDGRGNQLRRLIKTGLKRKKSSGLLSIGTTESTSPLQSIHWFRVVLDEAQ